MFPRVTETDFVCIAIMSYHVGVLKACSDLLAEVPFPVTTHSWRYG